MKKNLVLSLFLGAVLSSCYFVNDIFDPPAPKEQSLQEKSEIAVRNHIKKTTDGMVYQPFGFGKITIHKPQEIVDLELLEKKRQTDPSEALDTAIAQQKRYIIENNIERTVDLDHFFTLKDSIGNIRVFETNFILNDTLGVKDLSAKIMVGLADIYEDALNYYFYEYNIFSTPSYYESRQLSANFFAFFKQELENRIGREQKSAFLLHVVKLTHEVKERGSFNQQEILEENVEQFIRTKRTDISEYESLEYSDLFQTQEEETQEVNGYYFFHKFIGTFQEEIDTNVVLIEFSKFYEIGNIYQMDRPFNTYFNQDQDE